MNKEKFLKSLEKKLTVLSETERNDIINEYRDIIEEKVRHGKTEEEAVKEFGELDSLVKEILSAYKIDPEYDNQHETKNDFVNECEGLIKKGAQKLSEVTEDIIESFKNAGTELTLQNVFEILIKVILILLGLALLRIPFSLISSLGYEIFDSTLILFGGNFIGCLWRVIVEITYTAVCILLVISIIRQYIPKEIHSIESESKKLQKEKKVKTTNQEMVEKQKDGKKKVMKENQTSSIIVTLIKIFIFIVFILPLFGVYVATILGLVVAIYLIYKGVYIFGILLLLVATCIFIGHLTNILCHSLFERKKIHFYPFFVSIAIGIIGAVLTVDYVLGFTYYNHLPEDMKETKETYTIDVTKPTDIHYDEMIIDNSIEDNKMRIEVTYYVSDQYTHKIEIEQYQQCDECENYIGFYQEYGWKQINIKKFIESNFITYLKEKKIYDYSRMNEYTVKIYMNENTRDLVNS